MTKHEEIIKYIRDLQVGTKVSVRSLAVDLRVSEGTAYRAIKDAANWGFVSTIPRVGTIRIQKVEKRSIETLTYGEVVNIVDGSVLGGKEGLYKPLNKFLIGAMTVDAMAKYISPGNLLIVGNREEAFRLALKNECAVLITGGFDCSDEIKELADENRLPVISSSYDTFTIATMINKAISESLVKKEIILVEDILNSNPVYLYTYDTVSRLKELIQETGYSKFPVLDENNRLVGIVTMKDLTNDINADEIISRIMTANPITVTEKTSVAYAAHIMAWDSLELIPVVNNKKLVGIISRGDVLKAMQYATKQPQVSETVEDIIMKSFSYEYVDSGMKFYGRVTPEMYDPAGSASMNCLTALMSTACTVSLRQRNHANIYVDSFSVFYLKPVQIDSEISIRTRSMNSGRNFVKVDVEMYDDKNEICSKGMLSAKMMKSK